VFKRYKGWLATMLLPAMIAGCSDANVLGPGNQVQVANNPGTFEWQATAMDKIKETQSYQWVSNDTIANVNQSSSLSGGSASLQVMDADGVQVYLRGLDQNGTFQTSAGTAGTWTINIVMDQASGAINFRLDNP